MTRCCGQVRHHTAELAMAGNMHACPSPPRTACRLHGSGIATRAFPAASPLVCVMTWRTDVSPRARADEGEMKTQPSLAGAKLVPPGAPACLIDRCEEEGVACCGLRGGAQRALTRGLSLVRGQRPLQLARTTVTGMVTAAGEAATRWARGPRQATRGSRVHRGRHHEDRSSRAPRCHANDERTMKMELIS